MGKRIQTIFASLIGINQYEGIPSLTGCIADVLNMDRLLLGLSENRRYCPAYFLSPSKADEALIRNYRDENGVDLSYQTPSFFNIKGTAFEHLAQAEADDICILYFSGHGSYTNQVPEIFGCDRIETLLCMDSRSRQRDIMDKELNYLLYKVLRGKPDVHCLVITDCCHSGGVMRGPHPESNQMKVRFESPSLLQVPLEEYAGFRDGYFDSPYHPTLPRYVHFAACLDHQRAQETKSGGLFTLELVKMIESKEGPLPSYRHLSDGLQASLSRTTFQQQNPIAFAVEDWELDRPFLGSEPLPSPTSYPLQYNDRISKWELLAGTLLGLPHLVRGKEVHIAVEGLALEAKVSQLGTHSSIVEGKDLDQLEKSNPLYRAYITYLAMTKMTFGFEQKGTDLREEWKLILQEYKDSNPLYITAKKEVDEHRGFSIQVLLENGRQSYRLKEFPFLKTERSPASILKTMNTIGKWHFVKNIRCANPFYREDHFSFLARMTIGGAVQEEMALKPGDKITLTYQDGYQPTFRFSITFAAGVNVPSCYVQALYLDSLFGVDLRLIKFSETKLTPGKTLQLTFYEDRIFKTDIPVHLDRCFGQHGISSVQEYLRVFVSSDYVSLDSLGQAALQPHQLRSGTESETAVASAPKERWAVFDFPIQLSRPIDEFENGRVFLNHKIETNDRLWD